MITLFYLLVLEQILQGFYSLWQGLEWLKVARRRTIAPPSLYGPRVALICPVKGMEEDLEANLLALTYFDYPQYEIFFAIATAEDPAYRERPRIVAGAVERHNHRLDSDYYTQPGNLFRLMKPDARERLVGNIAASMRSVPQRIQELQLEHFYRADPAYGSGVAACLGLSLAVRA